MTNRPKHLTDEMKLAAAKATAADLLKDGQIEAYQFDDSVANLAKHGRLHIDGYALAKYLDNYCGWEIDAQMVETLDGFSWHAQHEVDVAEKAWAEATKPVPPHGIGTRVSIDSFNGPQTGTIDGIYEYGPAKYTVKIDGDKQAGFPMNARRIVNFEDAKLIPEKVS